MTTQTIVEQMIADAMARARDMTETARGYADDGVNAINALTLNRPNTQINVEKPVFTGSLDDPTSTFTSSYDARAGELVEELAAQVASFLNAYFPRTNACLTAAEEWLCDVIQNGGTGIPADVENQIWERSRSRELQEAQRREEEVVSQFAASGFTLPTGALAGMLQNIQQDVANKVSSHGRDVAIKQAEIAIETVRFAVSEALKYRLAAISAALEYWKNYLLPYDIAAKRALAEADWKTKFYNSAIEYFKAETHLYDSMVRAQSTQISAEMEAYGQEIHGVGSWAQAKAAAAMSAAKAAGDIAAAAQGGLNTLAQYGYAENYNSQ